MKIIKNIAFYFSVFNHTKINIYIFFVLSVFTGLVIPLTNVIFPKIIFMGLSGKLILFGYTDIPTAQIFVVISVFFSVTTLVYIIKVYIDKKISWYKPYLQFKLRENIQYRAMTMDFQKTEDKKVLSKYTNAEEATSRVELIFNCVCGIASSFILIIIYSVLVCRLHPALFILLLFNACVSYYHMVKSKQYVTSFRDLRAEIDRKNLSISNNV